MCRGGFFSKPIIGKSQLGAIQVIEVIWKKRFWGRLHGCDGFWGALRGVLSCGFGRFSEEKAKISWLRVREF
jgi:hypothetical protein